MSGSADLSALAGLLGHRFAEPWRLALALTHPSMVGLGTTPATASYERLEFLGDRVLGLVIAEWLLERHPDEAEGAIARRHTALVRADALVQVAEGLDLGRYLRLAPGEESGGGRRKPAILADACEAVIGALYLDGGLEPARAFVRGAWAPLLEEDGRRPPDDPKTALQQWALGRGKPLPAYATLGRSGPDHAPVFDVQVSVAGEPAAVGSGGSKREAEKNAATALLAQLGVKG
jgi:ribonuclease-3